MVLYKIKIRNFCLLGQLSPWENPILKSIEVFSVLSFWGIPRQKFLCRRKRLQYWREIMLTIKEYVRPQSLDEAYTLCQKRSNVVLGGMLWLKMQNRSVRTAIDLCDLGLDTITLQEDGWHIGAMVSLRDLELHRELNHLTQDGFRKATEHIVGVQFRNCATVGGSLYGRFGFSDILTLFQVLNARVVLHSLGTLTVEEFARLKRGTRDILVEVIVPDRPVKVQYLTLRNTATDFPVLACALSETDGRYTCAIGARPGAALPFHDDENLLKDGITEASAAAFGRSVASRAVFESNVRASAEYRRQVCAVLVKRAVLAMKEA